MSRKSEVRTKFQKNVVALWNMWMSGARHCTVAVESLGKMFARNVSNEKSAPMAFQIPTMIWCCWIWSWTKRQTGNWNSCERTREIWKDIIWLLVSKVALYRRKPATKLTRVFCYGGWCKGLCCHWRCCCCCRCCYTEHCFAPWHFRSSIDLVQNLLMHELNDEANWILYFLYLFRKLSTVRKRDTSSATASGRRMNDNIYIKKRFVAIYCGSMKWAHKKYIGGCFPL